MLNNLSSFLAQAWASELAQQGSRISGWVWVVIFILVTLLVWWLLTRASSAEPGFHVEHADHHEEAHAVETTEVEAAEILDEEIPAEPVRMEAVTPTVATAQPDDLTVLEGIGPKVKGVLQAAGITTFAQLAAANLGQLNKILDEAGYAYMNPESWPEQARLLAEGRIQEFEELTARLKGGRIIS